MNTASGNTCNWNRKLCVTCRQAYGITLIRVQTNSFPDHCFEATNFRPAENKIDFEVAFEPSGIHIQT